MTPTARSPIGQVVYSVSHAHDCTAIGDFPDTNPRVLAPRAGRRPRPPTTDIGPDAYGWNYNGQPGPDILHWYPDFGIGTYTGQFQAAWAVTGNSQYLALGGEFPTVNGKASRAWSGSPSDHRRPTRWARSRGQPR